MGRNKISYVDYSKKIMNKDRQKELLELVRRNYDEIADDFSETRKKELWPELVKWISEIKDGSSVLDVGCGSGRLARGLEEKNIQYVGVDNSERLVGIARNAQRVTHNARHITHNKKFYVGDMLNLGSIPENDFNYVFSVAVLHHIPGDDLRILALQEMKKKLKKDGKIFLTVWNLWSHKKYLKIILKFSFSKLIGQNEMDFGDILFDWKDKNGGAVSRRYYHAFTKRELTRLIEGANLKIERISKDKYNYYLVLST